MLFYLAETGFLPYPDKRTPGGAQAELCGVVGRAILFPKMSARICSQTRERARPPLTKIVSSPPLPDGRLCAILYKLKLMPSSAARIRCSLRWVTFSPKNVPFAACFHSGARTPLINDKNRTPSEPGGTYFALAKNTAKSPSTPVISFNHCRTIPPLFVGPPMIAVSFVKG